jgi:hypothetical protein
MDYMVFLRCVIKGRCPFFFSPLPAESGRGRGRRCNGFSQINYLFDDMVFILKGNA